MKTVRKIFFSCKFSALIVNNQIILKCSLLETVQFHYFMSWNWISNAKIALSEISSRYIDNSKCWVHLIYMTVWYRIPISSNPTIVLLEWHGKCCAIIALNATFTNKNVIWRKQAKQCDTRRWEMNKKSSLPWHDTTDLIRKLWDPGIQTQLAHFKVHRGSHGFEYAFVWLSL